MAKIVQHWLRYAREDLAAAKALLSLNDESFYRNIGFHCQQSAEKSMKALLSHHKIKFTKTHDLKSLGELLMQAEPDIKEMALKAISLTPYAVEFRYPESADKPITKGELFDATGIASGLLDFILGKVKS